MMTVKDLIQSAAQTSPDGEHWEPALPMAHPSWKVRLRNAYAVWKGEASAIRQTTKADLSNIGGAKLKEKNNG